MDAPELKIIAFYFSLPINYFIYKIMYYLFHLNAFNIDYNLNFIVTSYYLII